MKKVNFEIKCRNNFFSVKEIDSGIFLGSHLPYLPLAFAVIDEYCNTVCHGEIESDIDVVYL